MNTPNETPLDSELLRLKSALAAETAPDFIAARLQAALQQARLHAVTHR